MSRYIEIPRDAIEQRLIDAGFSRVYGPSEVCYERKHSTDSRFSVVVWTSIPEYDTVSRNCGTASIRVLSRLTWTIPGEDVPHHKVLYMANVYRVGTVDDVLGRVMERAADFYARIQQEIKPPKISVRA